MPEEDNSNLSNKEEWVIIITNEQRETPSPVVKDIISIEVIKPKE